MAKENLNAYLRESLSMCRRSLFSVVVFSFIVNLLMLTVPIYLLQLYDRVIPNRSTDTLLFLTLIVFAALIALAALEAIRRLVLIKIGVWLEKRLSGHILSGSITRALKKNRASSTRALHDLATLRNFFWGSAMLPILDIPWTPVFILVLFLLHPLIGSITLAGALILFSLALANEYITRSLVSDASDASSKVLDQAASMMRNADVIESMGMRSQLIARWSQAHNDAMATRAQATTRGSWITSIAKFLRLMLQVTVIGAAAWLIIHKELTTGALIASMLLMQRAISPIDRAIVSWKSILGARNALHRVSQRLNESPTLEPSQSLPAPAGELVVNRLNFHHSSSKKPVLYHISFNLNPGQILGLVGPTAAGKSTLARLLVGLAKPSSGHIRLGDVDISAWSAEQRGPDIGYLPQDVELFEGTVADNISRMRIVDIDAVVEAAKRAGVHQMILQLPKGYHTEIGEDGVFLSGGQRQRIALARAVFGDPLLIVLDEPDANLDRDGKAALIEAIKQLRERGAMIVLITHDSTMLPFLDHVLILNKSRGEFMGSNSRKLTDKINVAFSKVSMLTDKSANR